MTRELFPGVRVSVAFTWAVPFLKAEPQIRERTKSIGDLKDYLSALCDMAGFSVEDVLRKDNRRELVTVRRAFARVAHERGASLPLIGRILNRHHSTVHHLLHVRIRE